MQNPGMPVNPSAYSGVMQPEDLANPLPPPLPSVAPVTRAEARFKVAVDGLKSVVPSETTSWLGGITFPPMESIENVDERVGLLSDFLDKIIDARAEVRNADERKHTFQRLVLSWFKASYPFANLFISVLKDGSSVNPQYILSH